MRGTGLSNQAPNVAAEAGDNPLPPSLRSVASEEAAAASSVFTSVDEMRERNRLAYLARLRDQQPETEQEYRGSDALTAKARAAKAQIRQTLEAARAARQHTTEETK